MCSQQVSPCCAVPRHCVGLPPPPCRQHEHVGTQVSLGLLGRPKSRKDALQDATTACMLQTGPESVGAHATPVACLQVRSRVSSANSTTSWSNAEGQTGQLQKLQRTCYHISMLTAVAGQLRGCCGCSRTTPVTLHTSLRPLYRYPGLGWVMWRSEEYLPESMCFYANYLGGGLQKQQHSQRLTEAQHLCTFNTAPLHLPSGCRHGGALHHPQLLQGGRQRRSTVGGLPFSLVQPAAGSACCHLP